MKEMGDNYMPRKKDGWREGNLIFTKEYSGVNKFIKDHRHVKKESLS